VDLSKINLTVKRLSRQLFFVAFIYFYLGAGVGFSGEIVAIVNKKNGLEHLYLKDLKNIYKGEVKYWKGGERVVLFLPPAGTESMKVLTTKVFRKKKSRDIFKFYLKAIFQQKFYTPPKSVKNTVNAVNIIASLPGGIAIVDISEIPDSSQVKTIHVEGF